MLSTIRLSSSDRGLKALTYVVISGLQGKKVSRARCSIGSVLLLDFGKLETVGKGKQKMEIGEWHLFIEMAAWAISKHGKAFLNSEDVSSEIKSTISRIEGSVVRETTIGRNGNVRPTFENGYVIDISKKYKRRNDTNWAFFYREAWWLGHDDKARPFEFACETAERKPLRRVGKAKRAHRSSPF